MKALPWLLMLFCADNCIASNWQPLYPSNSLFFVDWQSVVQVAPGIRKAWTMSNLAKSEFDIYSAKNYQSTKSLWEYNCEKRSTRSLQIHFYEKIYGGGEYIRGVVAQSPQFSDVIPDTVGETELNYVCAFFILPKK